MRDTILVTGTAGFIGFHLAQRLLERGHSVIGVDNFNDYYYVGLKEKRHEMLMQFPSFVPQTLDICNHDVFNATVRKYAPAVICHLAAQPGVRYSLINPLAYQKANIEGFTSVLESARRHNIKRFVYASSSSVYGNSTQIPLSEDQRVDHPISLYAATKKANELIAYSYHHLFGIQTIGLRFFSVYGEWGRPDMAYWIFAETIAAGKPISIFNNGNMKRDFTYIDDIISGLEVSLFADGLDGYSIFNLGNSRSENLLDMVGIIEEAMGTKAVIKMMPLQPGDVVDTFADIGRASEKLAYHPATSIRDGLPRFVHWYLNNQKVAEEVRKSRTR